MRFGARMPSQSEPRRRVTGGELCGKILAGIVRSSLSQKARPTSWPRSPSEHCPYSRRPATTWPCSSGTGRSAPCGTCAGRTMPRSGRMTGCRARQHAGLGPRLLGERATCRYYGTTPVSELWPGSTNKDHKPELGVIRALALAMLGRFDEARAILAEKRAQLAESGAWMELAGMTASASVEVELLAGNPAAAAEFGAEGCRQLEELGERSVLSTGGRRTRAGAVRARPTRRGRRLGRTRSRVRLERRRDHTDALAAGGRRCSRVAMSPEQPNGSRVRRSRSARKPTCSTTRRRLRRPRRSARTGRSYGRGNGRARAGARTLRAQRQPRLGTARPDAAR